MNKPITQTNSTLSIELKELLKSADIISKVKKDTFLFQEGMTAKEIYIIRSGRIKISKITADGRELTLRICKTDDLVGELTLFTENAKYLFNARVVEDGEVAVINNEVLERKLFENSELAFEFMKWMSDHFRKTQTKFRDLVLLGKKGALYSTLVRMTNSYGIVKDDGILIDIPLTNQELANFCGTSRESTNRMLNDLRKNKILSISKGKITIHDLAYIKKEINCEGCPAVFCSIE
ncbi:Crp/Fnr family transcriptional regulator [Cytobacillus sp. S13-E01]|uniref:Crp/Fnr family transcriptional regulator n=1 Tax=Cytobacillus sp. S13-E01 TaxID=3031326 RepID=UPI0023D8856F|nr:Crp/Fnr family transcriptional regulator [Cytobacillus sp. S13-E01]MDF0727003.1 Crp/Fnr family transcriptional regulator [Cytobacillus sp. S13-E01]